jgi:hypothetical protein
VWRRRARAHALIPYVIKLFHDMPWDEPGGKFDDEMRAAYTVTKAVLPAMTECTVRHRELARPASPAG